MKESTAVLLGAGFSKWNAGLPVANSLFDFKIVPFGTKETAKLEELKSIYEMWLKHNPIGLAEQFVADYYNTPISKLISWYITRRLSEPFIKTSVHQGRARRKSFMIDDTGLKSISGVHATSKFLNLIGLEQVSGIITTNYDLLLEYALGTSGFNYGYPGQVLYGNKPYPISLRVHSVVLTGTTSIAKIHGSISWDKKEYYCDGRRGITGNALIVPPLLGKEPSSILEREWLLARNIIKSSKNLIVCGFAFNLYDKHVLELLREADLNLENILVLDPSPSISTIEAIWPSANITFCTDVELFNQVAKKFMSK